MTQNVSLAHLFLKLDGIEVHVEEFWFVPYRQTVEFIEVTKQCTAGVSVFIDADGLFSIMTQTWVLRVDGAEHGSDENSLYYDFTMLTIDKIGSLRVIKWPKLVTHKHIQKCNWEGLGNGEFGNLPQQHVCLITD